jgi:hypothetical protein
MLSRQPPARSCRRVWVSQASPSCTVMSNSHVHAWPCPARCRRGT